MNFSKFFPLLNKPGHSINDQPLVDAYNEQVDPDIQESAELLGIQQNPQIPFAPEVAARQPAQQTPPIAPVVEQPLVPKPKQEEGLSPLPTNLAESFKPIPDPQQATPDHLTDLKAAQERQGDLDLIDNMLRAGTTIGSSIARTKADYSPIDALQKQNSREVENVKQRMASQKENTELTDDKTLRDPKSDVSKAFRSALDKLGIPYTEKTTAWDAKALGINPQNLLMQDRALEKQMKLMERKEQKEKDSFVTGAQKSLMKPYQSYQKVATARSSLDGYLKGEPSGPKDIAILYDFIKGLDPDSAVKEGEIELGKSAMSLMEQYGIKAKKLTNSDVLSPKFRSAISDIMKTKEAQARSNYEELAQPFKLHGSSRGLSEEDYGKFDYLSAADAKRAAANSNPASVVTEQAPSTGLVERKTKDGKIALFDPTTKQFVKYKE